MSEESNLIPKMNNYREILEYVQKIMQTILHINIKKI